MCEYIYLVQEREFVKSNEDIYKIGKSKQENLKRFNSYPNGSKLLIQCICTNCNKIERKLIKLFREKYEIQRDIGNEYFKGNYIEMIKDIHENIFNFVDDTEEIFEDDFEKVVIREVIKNEIIGKKEKVVKKKIIKKNIIKETIVKKEDINIVVYNCDYCDYTSNKKANVILHTDIKHRYMKEDEDDIKKNEDDNDLYKCDKCDKAFSTKFNLTRHKTTCKGIVNPFQCQKCNKVFSTTSNKCRHARNCKNKRTL
jgi:hypothetical protein